MLYLEFFFFLDVNDYHISVIFFSNYLSCAPDLKVMEILYETLKIKNKKSICYNILN